METPGTRSSRPVMQTTREQTRSRSRSRSQSRTRIEIARRTSFSTVSRPVVEEETVSSLSPIESVESLPPFALSLDNASPLPTEYPALPTNVEPLQIDARDKGTPDEWLKRDARLVRLTGRHPLNVEPPLPDLWKQVRFSLLVVANSESDGLIYRDSSRQPRFSTFEIMESFRKFRKRMPTTGRSKYLGQSLRSDTLDAPY